MPHYYKGEMVGEHRRYNDHLAMFLMRHNDQGRYARGWDKLSVCALREGAQTSGRAKNLFHRLDVLSCPPDPSEEKEDPDDVA